MICNASANEGRRRFTVAHEVGHYLMHRHLLPAEGIYCKVGDLSHRDIRVIEREADTFAASLLMPFHDLRRQLDPRAKPTWKTSARWPAGTGLADGARVALAGIYRASRRRRRIDGRLHPLVVVRPQPPTGPAASSGPPVRPSRSMRLRALPGPTWQMNAALA